MSRKIALDANAPAPVTTPDDTQRALYFKVAVRLVPFLIVCYVVAYLDRINVGFAKLQMQEALGFSDAVYGLGAGIFFIGYFLFEVRKRTVRILDLKRVFPITRGFEHGKDEESDGAGDIRQPARV